MILIWLFTAKEKKIPERSNNLYVIMLDFLNYGPLAQWQSETLIMFGL